MSSLYALDAWLIHQCERFSHWTQRLIGLRSVHWERVAISCAAFGFSVYFFHAAVTTRLGKGMYLWFIVRLWESYRREECSECANPEKIGYARCVRLLMLAISPVSLTSLLFAVYSGHFGEWVQHSNIWFECIITARYFAACDDLPIAPSRLAKFVRSLSFGRQPIQAES